MLKSELATQFMHDLKKVGKQGKSSKSLNSCCALQEPLHLKTCLMTFFEASCVYWNQRHIKIGYNLRTS